MFFAIRSPLQKIWSIKVREPLHSSMFPGKLPDLSALGATLGYLWPQIKPKCQWQLKKTRRLSLIAQKASCGGGLGDFDQPPRRNQGRPQHRALRPLTRSARRAPPCAAAHSVSLHVSTACSAPAPRSRAATMAHRHRRSAAVAGAGAASPAVSDVSGAPVTRQAARSLFARAAMAATAAPLPAPSPSPPAASATATASWAAARAERCATSSSPKKPSLAAAAPRPSPASPPAAASAPPAALSPNCTCRFRRKLPAE